MITAIKREQGTEDHRYRGGVMILNMGVRVDLTYEVTFEQRLEEGKG